MGANNRNYPPSIVFPRPGDKYSPEGEARRNQIISDNFGRTLSKEQANPFVLLLSPSGLTFKLSVNDDGTLSVVAQ